MLPVFAGDHDGDDAETDRRCGPLPETRAAAHGVRPAIGQEDTAVELPGCLPELLARPTLRLTCKNASATGTRPYPGLLAKPAPGH